MALTWHRLYRISLELLVCAIHPYPGLHEVPGESAAAAAKAAAAAAAATAAATAGGKAVAGSGDSANGTTADLYSIAGEIICLLCKSTASVVIYFLF